jgi:protein-disulfide isomerase
MLHKTIRLIKSGIAFSICALCCCSQAARCGTATTSIVATINGTSITSEDVEKATANELQKLELQRLQFDAGYARNKHQIMENGLARLIDNRVLDFEAKKRGIAKEMLLSQELNGKVQEPSAQDVSAFYEANKAQIGQPLEQSREKIQQYLKSQNYNRAKEDLVERLKKDYGANVMLAPMRSTIETTGSPALGPEDAPVTLVEFADFQCPFCSRLAKTLKEVLANYGKDVRLVFRQFPLSEIHPFAENAAEASLCAADQGHFWEMHDLLYASQGQINATDLGVKTAGMNLDMQSFSQCVNSRKYANRVQQDFNEGIKLGIAGTPVVFVNGRFFSGALPLEDLSRIIDEEIRNSPSHATASNQRK